VDRGCSRATGGENNPDQRTKKRQQNNDNRPQEFWRTTTFVFIRVDEINEAVQGGQKYGEEQHSTKHETSLDGLGWDCATRCVFSDPYRSYSLVRLGPF
jgi:hypothetical protein